MQTSRARRQFIHGNATINHQQRAVSGAIGHLLLTKKTSESSVSARSNMMHQYGGYLQYAVIAKERKQNGINISNISVAVALRRCYAIIHLIIWQVLKRWETSVVTPNSFWMKKYPFDRRIFELHHFLNGHMPRLRHLLTPTLGSDITLNTFLNQGFGSLSHVAHSFHTSLSWCHQFLVNQLISGRLMNLSSFKDTFSLCELSLVISDWELGDCGPFTGIAASAFCKRPS